MEEIVDIYDVSGTVTGRTIVRGEKLADGEYIMAVGMWVVTPENRILLTKRSPEKSFAPNKWENTGGHVQAGESCTDAVIRELFEETGIVAQEKDITFLGSAAAGVAGSYLGRNYLVRMDITADKVRLQPGETCEARLVTYDEFVVMAESGELASSVIAHMQGYKDAFLKALGR